MKTQQDAHIGWMEGGSLCYGCREKEKDKVKSY